MPYSSSGTTAELFDDLRSGRISGKEAFRRAREMEADEQAVGLNDEELIGIYQASLERGLTFRDAPVDFLDACKRVSRLLFRYGRARDANNYLLQLRDLSPDPTEIPAWAWAYSSKLAYLEDVGYCIQNPEEVLSHLAKAEAKSAGNPQSSAVLADFINCAIRELSAHPGAEAAHHLSGSIRQFLERSSLARKDQVYNALARLERLVRGESASPVGEPASLDSAEMLADCRPVSEDEKLRTRIEVSDLRVEELSDQNAELREQNETLLHENERLRQEMHLLREQTQQDSTLQSRLANLIGHFEAQLKLFDGGQQNASSIMSSERSRLPSRPDACASALFGRRSRILVVGQSQVSESHLLGICKTMGLKKNQVDFRLAYDAFDSLDIKSLQYNNTVAGILVGPLPHKVRGQDNPIEALIDGDGYPPTVRVESRAGELKITKSSFKEGLENLLTSISSVEPSSC